MYKPVTLSEWLKAMKLTFSLILVLVLVIAFFLGINLGLRSYYESRDKPILARIDELKTFINEEERWLLQAQKNLEHKKDEIQRLRNNNSEPIKVKDSENSKTLETAVGEYNALQSEYESRFRQYNEKVKEHNTLIEKISTRWYLMPIPK